MGFDYMNIVYAVLVLAIIGGVLGLALAFAAKVFEVKVDERQTAILEILPGANCGGCGFAGCANFAEAVVAGNAKAGGCVVGGSEVAEKVAAIMGTEAGPETRRVAFVHCAGGDRAVNKYDYGGVESCVAALKLQNGPKQCAYACLGFGDCVRACKFNAIHIENGAARVDREKCTGCFACKAACPRSIIADVPYENHYFVPCSSKSKGAETRKECQVGCIACRLCEKACEFDAIHVIDNLAVIDYSKCTACGKCFEACPRKLIVKL